MVFPFVQEILLVSLHSEMNARSEDEDHYHNVVV